MNNWKLASEFAKEYALTDTAIAALNNMKKSSPDYWADKTTYDFACWYFGLHSGRSVYEEDAFLVTNSDWYPCFEGVNGEKYVHATMYKHDSNLELYTICLAGNDDYSISKDFIGYDEAITAWVDLLSQDYVRQEHLPGSYFSN